MNTSLSKSTNVQNLSTFFMLPTSKVAAEVETGSTLQLLLLLITSWQLDTEVIHKTTQFVTVTQWVLIC